MLSFIFSAIKIIFLLGFLVFIHESGHFTVAKLCKIKVNEFAIGFGPTIFKKQGKETKYALRLVPLGGFVNMEGEEERSKAEGSFSEASILKRILIVLAGGIVNIIFGLLVYFIIASTSFEYTSNIVKTVIPEYENVALGEITAGDEIYKVNGKKIRLQDDLTKELERSNGEEITILIKRDGKMIELKQIPVEIKTKATGIYLSKDTTQIVAINEDSPAVKNGLEVNDIITKIDGEDIENNTEKLLELINHSEENTLIHMEIKRGNDIIQISVTPELVSNYYLGVELEVAPKTVINQMYYAFWTTNEFAFSIIDNLKMLFTGNVSINQFMGPVGISEMVSKTDGILDYIYFLSLISLSLGVTNLLPFPPLDGGKIVILCVEGIRKKPLKENIELGLQSIGFILLILLSIYVTYNDILRLF